VDSASRAGDLQYAYDIYIIVVCPSLTIPPMRAEYDFSKGKRRAAMPQKGKTRISIFIDNAVLDEFRARAEKAGTGYQTMMNEALKSYLSQVEQPITEKLLRQVLRQEIPEYLKELEPRTGGRGTKRRAG
jgi:uncharacterized protein (DUF4415 family)